MRKDQFWVYLSRTIERLKKTEKEKGGEKKGKEREDRKGKRVSLGARRWVFSKKRKKLEKNFFLLTLTSCPLAASSAATACITKRWLLPETKGTARTLSLGRRCHAGAAAKRGEEEVVVVVLGERQEEEPGLLLPLPLLPLLLSVVAVVGRGSPLLLLSSLCFGSGVGVGTEVGVGVGCLEAAMERAEEEVVAAAVRARASKMIFFIFFRQRKTK